MRHVTVFMIIPSLPDTSLIKQERKKKRVRNVLAIGTEEEEEEEESG